MRTSIDISYFAILTAFFIIFFGAMMTPLALAVTRPIHPTIKRLARKAAWNACKAALGRAARWVAAVATAGAALSVVLFVLVSPASAGSAPRTTAATTADAAVAFASAQAIERMTQALDRAAKHPVAQIAGLIARGYTAVKVYRLSREMKGVKADLAAVQAATYAILAEITALIERVEAGETLTTAQITEVASRLDVHAVRIASAEAEIEVLKLRMDQADRERRALDNKQREMDHQQRETEARQRETEARVTAQQKRIGRYSKTPHLYFDPQCNCRRDIRDRDTAPGVHVTGTTSP